MNDSKNNNNLTSKKGPNMYGTAAHNTYAQNNVGIESPTRLIEMLYEGVLRFNAQAKKSIKEGDIEKKVYWVNRSIAIITELLATLDTTQGDVSLYLEGLYNYELSLLTQVSVDGDVEKLDEVGEVFKGLLEAWRESTNVAQ
jgi:flagellar protein FliS